MKKKYDNFSNCYFMMFIFFISFLCVVLFLFSRKLITFKVFDGVIYDDNVFLLVLSDNDLKLFNRNKKLYIKNKSYKFDISKIDSNVFERNGDKYNNVFIKIDSVNMCKVNDVLRISIIDDKTLLYKIFDVIWDGD